MLDLCIDIWYHSKVRFVRCVGGEISISIQPHHEL